MEEDKIKEILDEQNQQMQQQQQQQMQQQQKRTFWNNKRTVKGKALSAWLIVIIAIFMLFVFGLGIYLGKELFAEKNTKSSKNSSNSNTVVNNSNNGTNGTPTSVDTNEPFPEEAKEKLNDFIEVAIFEKGGIDGTGEEFINGVSELTDKLKLRMVHQSVIGINKKVNRTLPEKYQSNPDLLGSVKASDLNSAYEKLFGAAPTMNILEKLLHKNGGVGCPFVSVIDEELGEGFLSHSCGGTCLGQYLTKIKEYSSDSDYYYVYQYVGIKFPNGCNENGEFFKPKANEIVNVTSFEGNEDKFETLKWTFDKNYNFISTENLG